MINKTFETNHFFSGGAGMFLQYHDIIKPIYFYAIIKILLTEIQIDLPFQIIKSMSITSLIEWYVGRRFKNPLRCIDFKHIIDPDYLDHVLKEVLNTDPSIYRLCPGLNIQKLLDVYIRQRMTFPFYVYSEEFDPFIEDDCKRVFNGISFQYLYGDLKDAIKSCDQNFTYIFSDIELVKRSAEFLKGTCSHILLAREYRYNYIDNCKTFKYDLNDLVHRYPFIRIGTTMVVDFKKLALSMNENLLEGV